MLGTTVGTAVDEQIRVVLRRLSRFPGPIASVYLDTSDRTEDAAGRVALRWRALRRELVAAGAPETAVAAVDPAVEDSHAAGHTLVAFADADGLLHVDHRPERPPRDVAVWDAVADVVPLLAAAQLDLPHLVVATDRLGAELVAVLPHRPDETHSVAGDELHVTRSAPGGWSQRRFQQRAENRWESNAGEVAREVTALVDRVRPRLVVLSGDVRAVQFLRDQLPSRVVELAVEVQGDYSTPDEALAQAGPLLAEVAARDTADLLESCAARLARGDGAAAGAGPVLTALSETRVATLLVDPHTAAGRHAFLGPAPTQVADTADRLWAFGVEAPARAGLAPVAVRAATGGGADVRIVPADSLPGSAELAAVLRG